MWTGIEVTLRVTDMSRGEQTEIHSGKYKLTYEVKHNFK